MVRQKSLSIFEHIRKLRRAIFFLSHLSDSLTLSLCLCLSLSVSLSLSLSLVNYTDEVDRIERKIVSVEDMYGRANSKPEPLKFDAEDMRNMRQAEETRLLKAREMAKNDLYWHDIKVEKYLGLETEKIKWKQNQTYVEILVRLDGFSGGMSVHTNRRKVKTFKWTFLDRGCVHYKDEVIIDDKKLYKDIKVDLSTWVIVDNVLEICLLKFCRR